MSKLSLRTLISLGALSLAGAAHAQLITNGGFEASSSNTTTPTGWFNIGSTQGILMYSQVPMQPVYEGLNFYDFGGPATNGFATVGDGVAQTFTTIAGARYHVSFAYTGENVPGSAVETLQAQAAGSSISYTLTPTNDGVFARPWSLGALDFTATATSTTLSFTLASSIGAPGNNDPLLDGVSVVLTAVPEPASGGLLLAGGLALAGYLRRRAH